MDRRIIEGIDACRPGSSDIHSPELNDVERSLEQDPAAQLAYARIQQWDAAVSVAVENVPVPVGLSQRILARLQATAPAAQAAEPVTTPTASHAAVPHRRRRMLRRSWLAVGSMAAAGLLVASFFGNWWRADSDTPVEMLADEWLQKISDSWRPLGPAPAGFEVPPAVIATAVGWQPMASPRGVVYKLAPAHAVSAKLFVARFVASKLSIPTSPPAEPQSTTGGKAIGYWKRGSLIYVLVVEGDQRSYHDFVSTSTTPTA